MTGHLLVPRNVRLTDRWSTGGLNINHFAGTHTCDQCTDDRLAKLRRTTGGLIRRQRDFRCAAFGILLTDRRPNNLLASTFINDSSKTATVAINIATGRLVFRSATFRYLLGHHVADHLENWTPKMISKHFSGIRKRNLPKRVQNTSVAHWWSPRRRQPTIRKLIFSMSDFLAHRETTFQLSTIIE